MARNIEELINRQIHRWNSISAILRHEPAGLFEDEFEREAAELERNIHPVICISRQMGSGARDIARLLCQRLNYELFGSEIINQIARDLKVQSRLVESLDEHHRGQLQLLIDSFLSGHEIEISDFTNALARIVHSFAMHGGVVILGRGAHLILKNRSALNVRIVAPFEERVERVQHYLNIDPNEARRKVERCDSDRRRFFQNFFRADIDDPSMFDLIINTSRMPAVAATELILSGLRVRGFIPERIAMPEKAG